jgi:NADH-quinone oxidoreductase subunit G
LLGNAAAHHGQASVLLALCQWLGEQTGASVGFLTEAANTVGAQVVKAMPGSGGLNAAQMLAGGVGALLLLACEPGADSAAVRGDKAAAWSSRSARSRPTWTSATCCCRSRPFTETSGTFVNAEGRVQSFHAVVRPLGDTRPGWKVLRVLADLLQVAQPPYETSQDVLAQALGGAVPEQLPAAQLSNRTAAAIQIRAGAVAAPTVGIYQLDGIVRRAPSLQQTADALEGASA